MSPLVVGALQCPVCQYPFAEVEAGRTLRCGRGHSFDIAREGYVNLRVGAHPHTGDSGEMVAARAAFLGAGHFGFIADAVVQAALRSVGEARVVVDAGAGTGYYLKPVLEALPSMAGIAIDASKAAIRRAARAHDRAAGVLCDVWGTLPVGDGVAGLVLNVFAPRNGREFRRILVENGALVVVTPLPDHLRELQEVLGLISVDAKKEERVAGSLGEWFDPARAEEVRRAMTLSREDVRVLVAMGPSARHVEAHELEQRIGELPERLAVTASVRVAGYLGRPRG